MIETAGTRIILAAAVVHAALSAQGQAKDWPQYKGDPARSGIASEELKPPLSSNWIYQPPQAPRPAWEEPGKEAHRLAFDFSPQPVIAGGRVFFGSSADDTVRALDLGSGRVVWRFTTGGPVRFAPAVAEGKVYVGSDDGWLYCLDAQTGKLTWRFHAAPGDDLILGNGRMISRWPLRSGAVVVDGVVYTVAGMWPTEGVVVYALDAKTGKVVWRNDSTGIQYVELPHPGATGFSGVAPQGYLAVSGDVLLVPTGRSCPAAFDRRTGKFLYCWPHRSWLEAKRGGCWLTTGAGLYFNPTREVTGTSESYVGEAPQLPDNGVVAYDIKTNKPVIELKGKNRVLVAGDILYAVGNGEAAAYDLTALRTSKDIAKAAKWTAPHLRVYSLALAGKTLFVGGKGVITALDANTGKRLWHHTRDIPGPIRGLAIGGGRLIASTDHGVLTCFSAAKSHLRTSPDVPDWRIVIADKTMASAEEVVERSRKDAGYALLVGDADGALVAALAMRSRFHVIHAVQGEERAAAERQKLMHTDLYGSRIAVVGVADLGRLPFAPYFADLILVTGQAAGLSGRELYRVLRPCGGVLLFHGKRDPGSLVGQTGAPAKEIAKDAKGLLTVVRGPLPDAGEWRHEWADGGRSGIGAESRLTMPLQLLWFGGPGPNRMMDRHYGSSPPLSVDGRVFVTGEHHLIAFDAYTGRELWSRPMRGLGRKGVFRSTANFAADDDMIYAVIGSACYRIRQTTGEHVATHTVPEQVAKEPGGWSYMNVAGDLLLGSCSGNSVLFALDKRSGALRWQWRPDHRVPPTAIAWGNGRLYCLDIESPDEQARRRGVIKKPARRLVALNLADGTVVWRQYNVPRTPADWVQLANGVISIYANVAYDADSGKQLWKKATAPNRAPLILGDWVIAQPHAFRLRTGEQRMTTDPVTGEQRPWRYIQSYGCGGVAGCQSLLFFRSAAAGFYDFEKDATTTFGGIRVGCSINMVTANGLAILPETSSGCPCSYNFQTSVALVPDADRKPDPWLVFAGRGSATPLTRASLNFGAPGDRLDAGGVRWLSIPRPILHGAAPVKMNVSSKDATFYRHPHEDQLTGMNKTWLYGSGVRNPGRITLDLIGLRPLVAYRCEQPLVIDGKLDKSLLDTGGKGKVNLVFSHGLRRRASACLRYDDQNLYVAITTTEAAEKGSHSWVKTCKGQDARVWEDDSWELYISDQARRTCVHLGVSASGARFDGLWDYGVYDALRSLNRTWNGSWKSAVSTDDKTMTVEVAVPFEMLTKVGLKRDELCLNLLGTGPGALGSPDVLSIAPDGFCARWRGSVEPTASETYTFTVRSDHLALLRIGDKTVIRHNGKGKPTETSATVPMKAGVRQPIEMVYEEARGTAVAQLSWSSPSTPKSIVPASAFRTSDGKPGGLSAAYTNRWYEDPILERVDAAINFEWKDVDPKKVPKAELRSHGAQRPQRGEVFLPVSLGPPKVKKTYAVRLHFAEVDDVKAGQRVFDVKIQDKPVLQGFDVVREAKGRNRPVVKAFRGISGGPEARIAIELIARSGHTAQDTAPILSGLEIVAE